MVTREDFIEDLWRDLAGLPPKPPPIRAGLEDLERAEWCEEFIDLMKNRLLMGAYRYGSLKDGKPRDDAGQIKNRTDLYIATGNLEMLIDAANFCMTEYMCGNHPKRHFRALDNH